MIQVLDKITRDTYKLNKGNVQPVVNINVNTEKLKVITLKLGTTARLSILSLVIEVLAMTVRELKGYKIERKK